MNPEGLPEDPGSLPENPEGLEVRRGCVREKPSEWGAKRRFFAYIPTPGPSPSPTAPIDNVSPGPSTRSGRPFDFVPDLRPDHSPLSRGSEVHVGRSRIGS